MIEAEARPQFLIAKYELGVFASMKAVEVRVRKLAGFGNDVAGVDLMNKAFGPGGTLTDRSVVKGERESTRALFAGAYAVLRNPAGHREVNYDDVSEAAEASADGEPPHAGPRSRRGPACRMTSVGQFLSGSAQGAARLRRLEETDSQSRSMTMRSEDGLKDSHL